MAGAAGGVPTNPMQQAAQAQQGALAGTVGAGTTNIGTIAGSNIGQYQNPYTEQVIKANEADILRGAQMGLNALGTQASNAGAFGGSRHGVAMGEMGRNVLQQLGQSSANLRQQGFMNAQQMAQADIQNRLAQANLGLAGAQQLGGLGAQSFGYGQQIQQGLAQQGAQQQALNQALIDAAKGQFAGYTGQPLSTLGYVSQALGATPVPQTQTTSKQPGLMDYLTLAATVGGGYLAGSSDERLKTNIKIKKTLANGLNVYSWDWNELGEKIKAKWQPAYGVIAQEVAKVFPEAVKTDTHGYLVVNYAHPELKGAI